MWYIGLDFVHLSMLWSSNIVYIALYIALYCIYAFWVVITHELYIRRTDTTVGLVRIWNCTKEEPENLRLGVVGWTLLWDPNIPSKWLGSRGKEKAVCCDLCHCRLLPKSDPNAVYSPPNSVYWLEGYFLRSSLLPLLSFVATPHFKPEKNNTSFVL